jgi:hypothetical protein
MADKLNRIYLHRDDLETIQQFLCAFPDRDYVELTADSSSGIGVLLNATIVGALVNGHMVNVTKSIVDESSW